MVVQKCTVTYFHIFIFLQKNEENALHLAVGLESTTDGSALHLIDFLIQNKDQPSDGRFNLAPRVHGLNVLDRADANGNTPLHLCATLNRTEGESFLFCIRGGIELQGLGVAREGRDCRMRAHSVEILNSSQRLDSPTAL